MLSLSRLQEKNQEVPIEVLLAVLTAGACPTSFFGAFACDGEGVFPHLRRSLDLAREHLRELAAQLLHPLP